MDRWACVDLAALPLQLLLRREPDWRGHPTAVVAEDQPQAEVLWINRQAHASRIRTGMRYAEALSLVSTLRAGVVPEPELAAAIAEITAALRRFSPAIEPSGWGREPGVFWLDASGFERLQPSLEEWAQGVAQTLQELELLATVVVGFERFHTYALARQASFDRTRSADCPAERVIVFSKAAAEQKAAAKVALDLLELDVGLRDNLARLGIHDVAGMRRLPAGALLERFGKDSYRLRQLMGGERRELLTPAVEVEAAREQFEVDPEQPRVDRQALLFLIKQSLGELEQQLRARGEVFAALQLRCDLDDGEPPHEERIVPAEPTRDAVQLVELVRLRLEPVTFKAPLVGFDLTAETAVPRRAQGELFAERPKRDLRAANRALARLRAEFGDQVVVHAALRDGHLPEAGFTWQPVQQLELPRGAEAAEGGGGKAAGEGLPPPTLVAGEADGYGAIAMPSPGTAAGDPVAGGPFGGAALGPSVRANLVRRLLPRPMPLRSSKDPTDGWFLGGLAGGPVKQLWGPFTISGGWWLRLQHRDYYFVETRRGDLLWVYHDRTRRRWFLHGTVE
ncbi:MAG: DNA polymerase Y family protein [bacterium]|nr:DNA polymerase Y family protein [bacterium]